MVFMRMALQVMNLDQMANQRLGNGHSAMHTRASLFKGFEDNQSCTSIDTITCEGQRLGQATAGFT